MKARKNIVTFTLITLMLGCSSIQPYSTTAPVSSQSSEKSSAIGSSDINDPASGSSLHFPQPTAAPTAAAGGITGSLPLIEEQRTKDNFFKDYGKNPFVETGKDHLSTFAIDVDTAAYTWMRKSLDNNLRVNKDSVRTEEYINFFDYNYPKPQESKFTINTDLVNSNINNQNSKLLRIGLQGKQISNENRKDAVLTFVIDISGSMDQENRLGLVKQSLMVLLDQLRNNDKVAIVVFGSEARTLLQPTSITNKTAIIDAIKALQSEGATNTEAGLLLGYQIAEKNFKAGATNRIILCSDGVANVGATGPDAMITKIKQESESGISLSTVGFGMGNYNDVLMEQLADKGDGNYSYVDNLKEAERIFAENLTGTLQVIARDTKIQVDFNPDIVKEYRLLGYENRDVADKDFRNDQVDAGEVGSGHSVTALYELKLNDNVSSGKVANVYLRYKDVDNLNSVFEMSKDINLSELKDFSQASASFKLAIAVAEYAEVLKGSYWSNTVNLTDVLGLAKQVNSEMQQPEKVNEFVSLVNKAISLQTLPQ